MGLVFILISSTHGFLPEVLIIRGQFLKDNGIDGVPTQGNPLDNLIHALPDFEEDELPLNH